MNGWTLRTALLFEFATGAASAALAYRLLEWQHVSSEEFAESPDARLMVVRVLMEWGIASGCCGGLAVALALCAVQRRREIAAGSLIEKVQWAAAVVPLVVVVWTARGL